MLVLLSGRSVVATTGIGPAFSSGPTPASAVTTAAPSATAVIPANSLVKDMCTHPTAPLGYADGGLWVLVAPVPREVQF
jgi:hypothetical protein